ncbi:N-terminal glutamine amidohydrolase [Acrasis kona]|uniref:Protein N-terminal glutamine amidohydrolase n=1 Tax=Acrasis kona TaxID=1008807 RepID=A0AAW2ZFU9_9EUKA
MFVNACKMIVRNECEYASCYCEENIWKICEKLKDERDYYVLFISTLDKRVPIWYQGERKGVCVWDYHVVLCKNQETPIIYDFDTRLSFPCDFGEYIAKSFITNLMYEELEDKFSDIRFRVISSIEFYNNFSSDRSHMMHDGKYSMPPPQWNLIQMDKNCTHNLDEYRDMSRTNIGQIVNVQGLCNMFKVNFVGLINHVFS